jgi:hypothetical protein
MARRNTALAALGLLTLSLALVACSGTASPGATSGVAGETSVALPSESGSAAGETAGDTAGSSGQTAAEVKACDAIQTWSDEMRALTTIDTNTASVDDVKAQVIKIKTAWSEVKNALHEVDQADEQAMADAGKGLETAVDNVQTDVPVAQMVDNVQTAAEPVRNVYKEMANGLGCTLQNPY